MRFLDKVLMVVVCDLSAVLLLAFLIPNHGISVPNWLEEGSVIGYEWELSDGLYVRARGFHSWRVLSINKTKSEIYVEETWGLEHTSRSHANVSNHTFDTLRGIWSSDFLNTTVPIYFNVYSPLGEYVLADQLYWKQGGSLPIPSSGVVTYADPPTADAISDPSSEPPLTYYGSLDSPRFDVGTGLLLGFRLIGENQTILREEADHSTLVASIRSYESTHTNIILGSAILTLAPLAALFTVTVSREVSKYRFAASVLSDASKVCIVDSKCTKNGAAKD